MIVGAVLVAMLVVADPVAGIEARVVEASRVTLDGGAADSTGARWVVESAADAAERGLLPRWLAPWVRRASAAPGDRLAMLARGTAAWHRYRLADAEALLRAAARPNRTDEVSRLARLGLARLHLANGAFAAGDTALRLVQGEAREVADTASWIEALVLRAGIARRLRSAAAGEPLLDSAAALGIGRHPRLASTLHCRRAGSAALRGDLVAMRRHADAGLAAAREVRSGRLEAACHFTRATAFARAGATDSLRVSMARAVELQRATADTAALASAWQWQGYYLLALGRHHQANTMLAEAWHAAGVARSLDAQAWTALSRAALARSLSDAQATRRWLTVADSLMTRLGDREGEREVLRLQSMVTFAAGDTARGWRQVDDLLRRTQAAGDRYGERNTLLLRVRRAIDAGDASRARDALATLQRFVANWREPGFEPSLRVLEGEVALQERRWSEAERNFDSALGGLHPTQHAFRHHVHVMRAVARARQGQVDEAARDARAAEETHDRWRASLSDSALRLYATRAERGERSYRTELITLLGEAGRLEDALRLAESQRARRLREQLADAAAWADARDARPLAAAAPELAGIQRTIPDARTALVEYVAGHGTTPSYALVVTSTGIAGTALPSMATITPPLQRLLAGVAAGGAIATSARALGAALLDPLGPLLDSARVERLVIVADDALHLLPFDLLQLSNGARAIERWEIAVMPSMAIAAALWSRGREPNARGQVLALGDPWVPPAAGWRDGAALGALPGARREVAAIARRFSGSTVRTGRAASEASLKRLGDAGAQVVHLAAHGVTDAWDGRQAALVLAPGDGEDGMLYAGEVAALTLDAGLVVLSACRTNAGEIIAGEGVLGLTHAFLRAGARGVVTTSWRIPDAAVVPLMERFYTELAAGRPAGLALRLARLEALRRGDPPVVWAAFSLVGDPMVGVARR